MVEPLPFAAVQATVACCAPAVAAGLPGALGTGQAARRPGPLLSCGAAGCGASAGEAPAGMAPATVVIALDSGGGDSGGGHGGNDGYH